MRRCPHEQAQFCPLYWANHDGSMPFGCDNGDFGSGECAVARGMNYEREVALMRVKHPGFVEQCEWQAALYERQSQRERNLRLNGIH